MNNVIFIVIFKQTKTIDVMKVFKISLQFGILIGILLILYFVVLGFLGVNDNPIYSFANPIMMAVGISLAIRKAEMKYGVIPYKKGFELGIFAGIISTIIFSIFFITYFVYNTQFAESLTKRIGKYASTGSVFITVVIMGIVTAMITSFFLMQLHKRKLRRNPND